MQSLQTVSPRFRPSRPGAAVVFALGLWVAACGSSQSRADAGGQDGSGEAWFPCVNRAGTWSLDELSCEGVSQPVLPTLVLSISTDDTGTMDRTGDDDCTAATEITTVSYHLEETGSILTFGFGQRTCTGACTDVTCAPEDFTEAGTIDFRCERAERVMVLEHVVSLFAGDLGGFAGCSVGDYEVAAFTLPTGG